MESKQFQSILVLSLMIIKLPFWAPVVGNIFETDIAFFGSSKCLQCSKIFRWTGFVKDHSVSKKITKQQSVFLGVRMSLSYVFLFYNSNVCTFVTVQNSDTWGYFIQRLILQKKTESV